MTTRSELPDLGVGAGLRVPHYRTILEEQPKLDFFEIISENFMVQGGRPLYHLDRVRERYPLVQHGVSLNIGGPDALDAEYLRRLKALTRRVQAPWVSDHFCWCGSGGAHLHDLLPLPCNRESADRLVERARQVQDILEVPFALENASSYMAFNASTQTEWAFISEVLERADIGLLFDVNNVYVSAYNHDFDPYEFIRSVPHDRIVQIHLAGHTNLGKYIIDTHRGHVIDPVWDLYRETIRLAGSVTTLIEWDDAIPEFPVLAAEVEHARQVRNEGLALQRSAGEGYRPPPIDFARPREVVPQTSEPEGPWRQGGPRERAATA